MKLYEKYQKEVIPAFKKHFKVKNNFQVSKLEKIIVHVGAGEAVHNPKALDFIVRDLESITGQKALVTKAKKSIAGFKLREGMQIGTQVTLRKVRMYEFLDRLVCIVLPRVRDFRGLSKKSFDGGGNYNFGLSEQLVFPEINYDKTDKVRGLGVTLVSNTKNDEQALFLLESLGFPFRKG